MRIKSSKLFVILFHLFLEMYVYISNLQVKGGAVERRGELSAAEKVSAGSLSELKTELRKVYLASRAKRKQTEL